MKVDQFCDKAISELKAALPKPEAGGGIFLVSPGSVASDESDHEEYISMWFTIAFTFGNCSRSHEVQVSWKVSDGDSIGIEYGEDCESYTITSESIMSKMYFDLATENLEDKYVQF